MPENMMFIFPKDYKGWLILLTATASTFNVILMRNNELNEGIDVVDDQNNVVGTSKVAAKKVKCNVCHFSF